MSVESKCIDELLKQGGEVQDQIDVLNDQLEDETLELSDADREAIKDRLEILHRMK